MRQKPAQSVTEIEKMRENLVKLANETESSATGEQFDDNSEDRSVRETPPFRAKWIWTNTIIAIVMHICALYGLCLLPEVHFLTILWIMSIKVLSGIGTTMGAHRLYTHRTFKTNKWVEVFLVACFTMTEQGSLWTWIRDHRQHHKYSDTDADPHNAGRGFFFSHMGWYFVEQHPEVLRTKRTVDLSDIRRNKILMFHKKYYKLLFVLSTIIFPTMVPYYLWNENLRSSLFVCFFFRFVLSLHVVCSVNSFAHLYGSRPYNKAIRPRESAMLALITFGEGWHNFHHTFPWDYRASQYGHIWNLTAAVIDFCARRGWVYDLKEASPSLVEKYVTNGGDGTHPSIYQKFAQRD